MTTLDDNIVRIADSDKIDQIITTLQNYIIKSGIAPGTSIPPERELASQLGVSRFSLREALRAIEAQGLIEISRGRRPRVAKLSPGPAAEVISLTLQRSGRPLLQLIEARQGLESQIARLAAIRAEPSHLEAMAETIRLLRAREDDLAFCVEQDVEFHDLLVRASKNVVFEIMIAPLAELLRKSRVETIRLKGIERVAIGHTAVLDAIGQKDPERAARAMAYHLEMAEEDIRQIEGFDNVQGN